MGASIKAMRHSCPSGGMIRMPRPRTRTMASAAFGSGVARLKRPTTGYWPGTNTCAVERADPLPFASNVPVKQMPLAWLRRWPSAGPPGGAREATNLAGVSRCGESQPAVYAKATAARPTTAAMIASRATGKFPGDEGDWATETSFQSFDFGPARRLGERRGAGNASRVMLRQDTYTPPD